MPCQRNRLIDTINNLSEWDTANAEAYVNNLDQALAQGGVTSVSNDVVDAAITVAEVADQLEAGSGGGSLESNQSSILFKGANVIEVPLSYGYALNGNFSLGGNLKFMRARVYYSRIRVFDQDKDDFLEEAYDDYDESNNFGIDLGGLCKYKDIRFGLVGRNLNKPEFDYAGSGDYQVDAQVRAGLAYIPSSWLTIAVDVDVFGF